LTGTVLGWSFSKIFDCVDQISKIDII
jgi:hypothetical protein